MVVVNEKIIKGENKEKVDYLRCLLVSTIEEHFDTIVLKWVEQLQHKIESYKKRPIVELRRTTSEHLGCIIYTLKTGKYDKLFDFVRSIAPLRASHRFPISGVQHAFFTGKDIIYKKIFQYCRLSPNDIIHTYKLIDDPFERAMLVYSDVYERLQVKEAETRSRQQVRLQQKKRFIAEIKKEKEKLEGIIAAIGADIILFNQTMRIEWWYSYLNNERIVRNNAVGKSCQIMGWHRDTGCTICPTRRCFKSGQIERGIIEVAEGFDHCKSYQIISTPVFDATGKVKKVLELVQDVTDLRNLERKVDEQQVFLTAIANDAADAIIGLTVDDAVISWNKGAEKLFGYHSEEIIGQKFSVVIPELYLNEGWTNAKATLKEQGYVRNFETVCCTKDRKEILVDVTQSSITDDASNFIGTSLVVRDVTERKREEQKTIQTERMALVGQMAAKVAHEMRNPLSSISLNTELLEDEILSFGTKNTGESTELIRSIAIEVDRLAHLSDEYLNFSRLPALKLSHCNINTVITDLVAFQRKDLSRKNIEISSMLTKSLSFVWIDKEQLRRAMLNLLRNAAEALPDGGTITVQTAQTDGSIEIAVKDKGTGITQDDMTNIFNPFFSTKSIGTGLGLTITRQIVEEHGGIVTCQSQIGQGTTFTVLLPLHNKKNEATE